jgi:hypothetical protein
MMKIGMIVMMAVLLNLGASHAESVPPSPGFDRVGLASANATRPSGSAQFKAAPGEGADQSAAELQARKRELARRLVWLMLSAR